MIGDPEWRLKAAILSHKGLLLADPVVAEMNHAQWLFEAEALRLHKEEEAHVRQELIAAVMEASYTGMRRMMVKLLGLGAAFTWAKQARERKHREAFDKAKLDGVLPADAEYVGASETESDDDKETLLPLTWYLTPPEVRQSMMDMNLSDAVQADPEEERVHDIIQDGLSKLALEDVSVPDPFSPENMQASLSAEQRAQLLAMGVVLAEDHDDE